MLILFLNDVAINSSILLNFKTTDFGWNRLQVNAQKGKTLNIVHISIFSVVQCLDRLYRLRQVSEEKKFCLSFYLFFISNKSWFK